MRRLPAKPLIHDQAAAQSLEGMLFRVKLGQTVPADRNRRDVWQRIVIVIVIVIEIVKIVKL